MLSDTTVSRAATARASSPAVSSAARSSRQNRARLLSPASRESHATGSCTRPLASHELTAAVLPTPAGPTSRVSGPVTALSSASNSRSRATRPGGSRGAVSFIGR